ncbi:MAG: winged helix DNA-binding domain-containing protein, partial [Candidatus Micrarchaeota archaeon]|nr:winged helix DNA-binding domain-containing protein [Candidatus Micrarchaeota archaeon]
MEASDIPIQRLANQQISATGYKNPGELVSFMGATQAQSYNDALWAIGLRLKDATKEDIEAAVSRRMIVRTWPMRHTLHFVSPNDVRWMLALYRDEAIPTYQKRNGLTDAI